MPAVDKFAVGATFISGYYNVFCTKPKDLAKLYLPSADLRHAEGRDGMGKGSEAAAVLGRLYPEENRGKVVVKDLELMNSNGIGLRVKGSFTVTKTQEAMDFTQVFELQEHGESGCYGIVNDVLSWFAAEPATKQAAHGAAGEKMPPPPPTLTAGDWAMETPPLFARKAEAAEISPMDKPLAASAAPAVAPLDAKPAAPAKHVDAVAGTKKESTEEAPRKRTAAEVVADKNRKVEEKPKEEAKKVEAPKKEDPKAEAPVKVVEAKKEEAPKAEAEKPAPKVEAEEPQQQQQKTQEEVDFSKMSMLERIRYKQNLPEKPIEEKKKEEPKKEEKTAEEKKREGDRRREAGEKKKAEGESRRREGSEKKEGAERRRGDGERRKEGERKSDDKKPSTGEKKEVKSGEKSNSVVYYDLILKGLPKGTTVDELYALLDPYVSVQKPIKLEARPDKNDGSTIRTFAFALLNQGKGKYKTADEAVPALKKAKLTLGGANVIVDRVREKFDK